jgi:hypothetical protein
VSSLLAQEQRGFDASHIGTVVFFSPSRDASNVEPRSSHLFKAKNRRLIVSGGNSVSQDSRDCGSVFQPF